MARAPVLHSGGRRFESSRVHEEIQKPPKGGFCLLTSGPEASKFLCLREGSKAAVMSEPACAGRRSDDGRGRAGGTQYFGVRMHE